MKLDLLYRHAADLGVEVEWHDLGPTRRGDYCDDLKVIRMNHRLTGWQATATLAHEIGHAIYGDRGHHPATERRADRMGASLVITPAEYRAAERLVGHHPGALAHELGVTPRLVLAWRDWHCLTAAA